eukprot:SAG11_NODE_2394_length_3407_cov_1.720677_6_plen_74_part_00
MTHHVIQTQTFDTICVTLPRPSAPVHPARLQSPPNKNQTKNQTKEKKKKKLEGAMGEGQAPSAKLWRSLSSLA